MTCTRWQHHDVSSSNRHFAAVRAAKHQPGAAPCEAENLVGSRVIVMEVVDAVAPLWRPAILLELRFHPRRKLLWRSLRHRSINQNRQIRIVGHPPIAFQPKSLWLRVNHGCE